MIEHDGIRRHPDRNMAWVLTSGVMALLGSAWFARGPWLLISLLLNGVQPRRDLPSAVEGSSLQSVIITISTNDMLVAWFNAIGGAAIYLTGIACAILLVRAYGRAYRWAGLGLLVGASALLIYALLNCTKPAVFEIGENRFTISSETGVFKP